MPERRSDATATDRPRERLRDRAVSEVISFALIFSLIVATVALVYVSGIGGLESVRSNEQVNNAVRAFDILADNIDDIHREAAPSRATEIKVSDAQMEFGDPVRLNVTVRNIGPPNSSVIEYDPIVYSAEGGTDLVYGNGALFRQDRGGTTLDEEPGFLLAYDSADDEKTVVLPAIETRTAGPDSTGSQRTVLVRTLLATREVTLAESDPTTASSNPEDIDGSGSIDGPERGDAANEYRVSVRVRVDEARRDVWLDYLNELVDEQDSGGSSSFDVRDIDGDGDPFDDPACEIVDTDRDADTDPETIECSLAAENIYSTVTRVDVLYR
jgi:hypothetical protein